MEEAALSGQEMAGVEDEQWKSEVVLLLEAVESQATADPSTTPAGANVDFLEL